MRTGLTALSSWIRTLRRLVRDRDGVTALEYGLIAAVTVVALVTSFNSLSQPIKTAFNAISSSLH